MISTYPDTITACLWLWFTSEAASAAAAAAAAASAAGRQDHQCSRRRACCSTLAASSGGVSVHSGDKSCAGTTQWRKSEKSYDVEKNKEDPPPVQSEGLQNSVVPEALHQNTRVE